MRTSRLRNRKKLGRWCQRATLIGCFALTGCGMLSSFASRTQTIDPAASPISSRAEQLETAELEAEIATIERERIIAELTETPRGTRVLLQDATPGGLGVVGILVSVSATKVQLMNCLVKSTVPGPPGKLQCCFEHVPFQSFELSELNRFLVLAEPSPDFDPRRPCTASDVQITEVVMRNGERLDCRALDENSRETRDSIEDLESQVSALQPGVCVSLRNDAGEAMTATFLECQGDQIELMNCVSKSFDNTSLGPHQYRTKVLPFRSIDRNSLVEINQIAAAPSDFTDDIGVDCERYIVSRFVCQSGLCLEWGKREQTKE